MNAVRLGYHGPMAASMGTDGLARPGSRPTVYAALLAGVLLATTLVLASCCAAKSVQWIPDGEPLTRADIERLARTADISSASDLTTEEAPDARAEVLVWLRRQGPDGERSASLLTQGFPERTASVPVHVQIASLEGTRSLVVVEAYGGASGKLTRRRVWVFDFQSGQLTDSASFQ